MARSDPLAIPDNPEQKTLPIGALLMLLLALVVPSVGAVLKYTGAPGLAVYVLLVLAVLLLGQRIIVPWLLPKLSERLALWLAGATFLALIAAFGLVYPIANSGAVGGGTDRDEALNIAVQALARGQYPYYLKTYLNAPISPLPGSLLLAAPFVALGNSAYQNLFWIAALFLVLARFLRDARIALLLFWTVLGLSPLFWQEFVTGGDLLANSIFVCVFVILVLRAHRDRTLQTWPTALSAVLLGVGLASRPNYLLILLPLFAWLWRSNGLGQALRATALAGGVAAAITLPFYLYDPAGFSPLHAFRKIGQFDALLPFAGTLITAASGLAALALSLRLKGDDTAALLRACALPQALPVVVGLVFYLLAGRIDYTFPSYGFSFLWFGVLAAWMQMMRTHVLSMHSDA
jgi:hypothetical protein